MENRGHLPAGTGPFFIRTNPFESCGSAGNEFKIKKNRSWKTGNERQKNGDPAGIRTLDHRLKRAMLYRLSYQVTSVLLQNSKQYIPVS